MNEEKDVEVEEEDMTEKVEEKKVSFKERHPKIMKACKYVGLGVGTAALFVLGCAVGKKTSESNNSESITRIDTNDLAAEISDSNSNSDSDQ